MPWAGTLLALWDAVGRTLPALRSAVVMHSTDMLFISPGLGGQVLNSQYLLLQTGNKGSGGRHSLQYTSFPSWFGLTDIFYQTDAITELSTATNQKSVTMAS